MKQTNERPGATAIADRGVAETAVFRMLAELSSVLAKELAAADSTNGRHRLDLATKHRLHDLVARASKTRFETEIAKLKGTIDGLLAPSDQDGAQRPSGVQRRSATTRAMTDKTRAP